MNAQNRLGERVDLGRPCDLAVDPVRDELRRRVVGPRGDDRGRTERGRLDHHHPVPLADRRQQVAGRVRHRLADNVGVDEPGSLHRVPDSCGLDRLEHPRPLGAVAEDEAAEAGKLLACAGDHSRHELGALLVDVAPGEDDERLAVPLRGVRHGRAVVEPGQPGHLSPKALLRETPAVSVREHEGVARERDAEPLDQRAEGASDATEVLAPVAA